VSLTYKARPNAFGVQLDLVKFASRLT